MIAALVGWLAASGITAWASSGAVYPIANLVHLLGLVLLLGGIGIVDLRLLGAFPGLPAAALVQALTPFGVAGLVLLAGSGAILFAADASTLATAATFRWKLIAIGLALANAAGFRVAAGVAAGPVKLFAGLSLALWLTVATLGRMIAYS